MLLLLDWQGLATVLNQHYKIGQAPTGRPAHNPLVLFKMLLIGCWYSLSDEGTERACQDRLSFMRFLGLGLANPLPDATRLVRFRQELGPNGLEALMAFVNQQLCSAHVELKQGVMIDATVTDAARKPKAMGGGGDSQAGYSRKGGRTRLAYKAHVATDAKGLVLGLVTTPGNEHDVHSLAPVLDAAQRTSGSFGPGTEIIADKGYNGKRHTAGLEARGFKASIMAKGYRARPLSQPDKDANKALSKRRYVIERTFGSCKRWFNAGRCRYVGLAKAHFFHVLNALCYNLKRLPALVEAAAAATVLATQARQQISQQIAQPTTP